MKEERFFCDKCKEPVFAQSDLNAFRIGYDKSNYYGGRYMEIEVQYELCWNCAEKIGAVKRFVKEDKSVVQPVPDLKDRLFDIMGELAAYFKEE